MFPLYVFGGRGMVAVTSCWPRAEGENREPKFFLIQPRELPIEIEMEELAAYGPIWKQRSYGGLFSPFCGRTDRDARPSFGPEIGFC